MSAKTGQFDMLSAPRQKAISYQVTGDSREMFKSRWAYQVGDGPGKRRDRVDRLAEMIETGEWPKEISV